jgi:hypothetical protein
VREVVLVMPIRPKHGELAAGEKRRRAVTEFFGGIGKFQADSPNIPLKFIGLHEVTLCTLVASIQVPSTR